MPDITGIGIVGFNASSADNLSAISNAVNANQNRRQNADDFGAVIDATAMSIMAGATLQPQATPQTLTSDMLGDVRERSSIEVTARAIATRRNDYSQPSEMSEGSPRTQAETGDAFASGLETAVDTASRQMSDETASRLDVTDEQMQEAMAETGLTMSDLLTEDGLTELVMNLTGEDQAALLTDEELYADLQGLIETADVLKDGIAEEFDLTADMLEDAIELIGDREIIEAGQRAGEETEVLAQTVIAAEEDGDLTVDAFRPERRETSEKDDNDSPLDANVMNRENERPEEQLQARVSTDADSNDNAGARNSARESKTTDNVEQAAQTNAVSQTGQFLNSVNEALAGTEATYASQGTNTEAADVVRQVLEHLRSEIRGDVTELEMQLHPASLGRVNVNLTATDGGEMVARFTAQSEAVREALASQMPQLLQRFEEQGVKVNEVQVAVAEHGFDDAKDDNMRREEQQSDREQAINRMGRMRRVQIDLANMNEEDIEALDDADRIEAEMMVEEGNTVNYRA